jgi:hypothetical protein
MEKSYYLSLFRDFLEETDYEPYSISKQIYHELISRFETVSDFEANDTIRNYFETSVIPHKIEVFKAGVELIDKLQLHEHLADSFRWNLLIHDLSKFSDIEAIGYSKWDFKTQTGDWNSFRSARSHHRKNNPHHPEYWFEVQRDGSTIVEEMPYLCILEMIADWIAVGRNGESLFGEEWLRQNLYTYKFHPTTADTVIDLLKLNGFNDSIFNVDGNILTHY